jgi:acetylglutamate kinase
VSRILLKAGGAVVEPAAARALALHGDGHQVCVVHGAGPQISDEMVRRGLEVTFVNGRRVTSAEALEVVRESLSRVNAALCAAIGPLAVGLSGDEIGLRATRIPELGLVGDPLPSSSPLVAAALEEGRIPVVAPLAAGPLNVNADEAAVALAAGVGMERVLFETDVPGVLLGGATLSSIAADDAERLLADGTFRGGIVPKLEAAVRAARLGLQVEIGETAVVAEPERALAVRPERGR